MSTQTLNKIFRTGSKTYFYSSRLFPPKIRDEVTSLYAFVRVADNFVDQIPQDRQGFEHFWTEFWKSLPTSSSDNPVINSFSIISNKYSFPSEWIKAFESSMRSDLTKTQYQTLDDTLEYVYGSAEVIGLMMARILTIPPEAEPAAKMLGRAMQYANFIRDINEDLTLNRSYFPQEFIKHYGLKSLEKAEIYKHPTEFTNFVRGQAQLYYQWQQEAEIGFHFLPSDVIKAVKTASDMYKWTVKKIEKNPLIVYKEKVKPSIPRILLTAIFN